MFNYRGFGPWQSTSNHTDMVKRSQQTLLFFTSSLGGERVSEGGLFYRTLHGNKKPHVKDELMAGIQSNQKENIGGGQSLWIFQQLQINQTGP